MGCGFAPPSDQALITQFEKHAPHYTALITMLRDDPGVGTIADDFLFKADKPYINADVTELGITKDRLAEYKRLLALIKAKRLDRDGQGTVIFSKWASGFAGSTHHKGIIWTTRPVPAKSDRRFTPIRENWYIYQD